MLKISAFGGFSVIAYNLLAYGPPELIYVAVAGLIGLASWDGKVSDIEEGSDER